MPLRRRYIRGPAGRGIDLSGVTFYAPLWRPDLGVAPGGTFKSLDKYGHVCTVTGATWGYQGYTHDGDDKIVTAASTSFRSTKGTLILIVKQTAELGSARALIGIGNPDSNVDFICMHNNATGVLRALAYINNVTKWRYVSGANALVINTWQHIAVVHNGTSPVFYINGSLLSMTAEDTTDTTAWTSTLLTAVPVISIGYRLNQTSYLTGIGNEALYSPRAFSASEVMQHYQTTKWRYS